MGSAAHPWRAAQARHRHVQAPGTLELKGEFDPDFISATISGGHLWGLRWKYTHIPFETSENPPEVSETVDILDMWSFLEESYGKLSPADNQKVEKEANRTSVRLFGFDANNEDLLRDI